MTTLNSPRQSGTPMSAERHAHRQELAVLTRANHDIRSPLSVIFGVFELLEDAAHLTDGERRYLQLGMKAADELLSLADDLRLYSAMERNLVSVEAGSIDLQAVAREALLRALGERQIALDTAPGPTAALRVRGDEGYLKVALASLARYLTSLLPRRADAAAALTLRQRLGDDGLVALEVSLRRAGEPASADTVAAGCLPDELGVVNGVRLIELMGGQVGLAASDARLEIRLPVASTERRHC